MAKSTRFGGPSHTEDELNDPHPPRRIMRPEIGYVDQAPGLPTVEEDESSAQDGGDSKQSTPKQETENERQTPSPRKAARTTANRSKAVDTETASSAHSTDGDGQSKENKPSDDVDFDI